MRSRVFQTFLQSNSYLEWDYIWKRFKNGVFSTVMVGQNFTIHSATMDDNGSYICYVTHNNDTSRIGTTAMEISDSITQGK
jgi:hypothetical protein